MATEILQLVGASFGKEELEEINSKLDDISAKLDYAKIDPILQEKTATENGEVVADEGYDGLSKVTVNVESSGDSASSVITVATVADLPDDAPDGTIAIVIGQEGGE